MPTRPTTAMRAAVASAFLGVAAQGKPAGAAGVLGNALPNAVAVDAGGVWDVDLDAAATVEAGSFVGRRRTP